MRLDAAPRAGYTEAQTRLCAREGAPVGTLYIVPTPIGNLEDITLRALRVLREAALIAAEDTRTTRTLLRRYDIHTPAISYHEHNKLARLDAVLDALAAGDVALVSDAGTPGISDPGYELVQAAIARGIRVVPLPGPSAIITALVASGLPTDGFIYLGFMPRRAAARAELLESLADERRTLVAYDSPSRLTDTLAAVQAALGDRPVCVARELTKVYEEFFRGRLSGLLAELERRGEIKGECTLLIGPPEEDPPAGPGPAVREEIRRGLDAGRDPREVVREAALRHGLPRRELYREAVKLKHKRGEPAPGGSSENP